MTLETVPADGSDQSPNWRIRVANTINRLIVGGGDNVGTLTLSTGTASTLLTDPRIGVSSVLVLTPQSTAAFNTVAYPVVSQASTATINHATVTATTTYKYIVLGS